MTYGKHFSPASTPIHSPLPGRAADMTKNPDGAYVFKITDWEQLNRFLILGCVGGTYYAKEADLTTENAEVVLRCLKADGPRVVREIVRVSDEGLAPKNDPAIFALAIAAGHAKASPAALAALPRVCRTGTHLFQFVDAVKAFRGWGRALKRAVAAWYERLGERDLCYQLVKYQQRNGRSHRDLFRLAHPVPKYPGVYRYVVAGAEGMGDRAVTRKSQGGTSVAYSSPGELPVYIAAFEELKTADLKRTISLIAEHRFTHEMVASEHKNSPELWEALLAADMPIGAMVRNLGKMTEVGLLKPMSNAARAVAERLADVERIRKARLHPISLLSALRVYAQGHGEKGKLSWSPVPQITDGLDEAFYLAFDAIEATGKRTLLALDVSGSMAMESSKIAGIPGLYARDVSAALAMVTARTEKQWHCLGFSHQFVDLGITPRMRLDDVIQKVSSLPFARTDCALPMLWAAGNDIPVDVIHVYTDSETWFGNIHPHQALRALRDKSGVPTKLAVVGMVSNGFTIADPSDPGQLDVVGCDTSTLNVLAEFARW